MSEKGARGAICLRIGASLLELEECRSLASEPSQRHQLQGTPSPKQAAARRHPGLLIILCWGAFWVWWIDRSLKARWARTEAIPKISQLIEQEKLGEAYALAVEAEKYISGDPVLDKLWPKISYAASVRTVPSGATVFRRNFSSQNNAWESLGRSPIENYRLPLMDSQWRLELAGFAPVERSTFLSFGIIRPSESISVKMDKATRCSTRNDSPNKRCRETVALDHSMLRPFRFSDLRVLKMRPKSC